MPLAAAAVVALACRLVDPAIAESSGVARAPDPAWFFTHNDSGDDARFFAVDRSCRTTATWQVRNAAATDWEDMAAGPDGALWFADIGDNRARRDSVTLYRVDTASLPADGGAVDADRVDLHYEDGPHDAETLLVHPVDGRTWVVTKDRSGLALVYEADRDAGVLRRVAQLSLDIGGATGGDISPDGRKVVLRTYLSAYEWPLAGDLVAAVTGRATATALALSEQGEAIAYVDGGRTLVTTAEGGAAAVRTLPSRLQDAPTAGTTRADRAETGDDPRWWVLAAAAAAVAAVTAALVARARRRGE